MSVQEIKEAVQCLRLEERAELAACLHSWKDDEWDEQMKRDLASGKLDKVLPRVDVDIAESPVGGSGQHLCRGGDGSRSARRFD
jgi:hypothetical protein